MAGARCTFGASGFRQSALAQGVVRQPRGQKRRERDLTRSAHGRASGERGQGRKPELNQFERIGRQRDGVTRKHERNLR